MNQKTKRLTKVECPTCHAPVGNVCSNVSRMGIAHQARWFLVDKVFPPATYGSMGPNGCLSEKKVFRANTSHYCKTNHCDQCSGKTSHGHGIVATCGCMCHKEKN